MKLSICLAKTLLIFYSLLTPFIVIGSLSNLIQGVILQREPVVHISAFALLGFILLPLLLIVTYLKNRCVIDPGGVRIRKVDYPVSAYSFEVTEYFLPWKERPIVLLHKKIYHALVVTENRTGKEVLRKDLNVFARDIERIKSALPYSGLGPMRR